MRRRRRESEREEGKERKKRIKILFQNLLSSFIFIESG